MPKKILQEEDSAVKIYPVATELVLLCVSCARGIIKEILHLANEQTVLFAPVTGQLHVH